MAQTSTIKSSDFRQLIGYATAKVAPGLISLITVPLWLRFFGEDAYAGYSIIWVVGNFGCAIAVGWMRQSILRFSGDPELDTARPPALLTVASIGVGALPLLILIGFYVGEASNRPLLLLSGAAFAWANGAYLIAQARAQSQNRAGAYSLAEIVRAGLALVGSLLFSEALGVESVVSMIAAYAISTIIAHFVIRSGTRKSVQSRVISVRLYWEYGWPMSIWLALSQVLVYFDRLVLAPNVTEVELGTYAATSDLIVRGISMVAFPITMFMHPHVMRKWNAGLQSDALRANRRSLWAIAALAFACIILLVTVGDPLISAILGTEAPDTPVILCLGIGAALWQMALQAHKPLEMLNRTGLLVGILATTCAFTLGALLLLVPTFGTIAAAATFAGGAGVYVCLAILCGACLRFRSNRRQA